MDLLAALAVVLLGITASGVLIVRSDRLVIALLAGNMLSGGLVAATLLPADQLLGGAGLSAALLAEVVLGLTIGALLAAAYRLVEQERSAGSRTVRAAAAWWQWPGRGSNPAPAGGSRGDLALSAGMAALAGVAAAALAGLYPLVGDTAGDISFYWPALVALLLLLWSRDVLRFSAGLLLFLHSGVLLMNLLAGSFEVAGAGLLSAAMLLVAPACGYLWQLAARAGGGPLSDLLAGRDED